MGRPRNDDMTSYKKQIDSLANEAAKHTDGTVLKKDFGTPEEYGKEWNKVFFKYIDRAAAGLGLRYSSRYPRPAT